MLRACGQESATGVPHPTPNNSRRFERHCPPTAIAEWHVTGQPMPSDGFSSSLKRLQNLNFPYTYPTLFVPHAAVHVRPRSFIAETLFHQAPKHSLVARSDLLALAMPPVNHVFHARAPDRLHHAAVGSEDPTV